MNDGFQFIDIIFFAMVAAFLVLRLRSVLGRRTGHERPPETSWRGAEPAKPDNVIELPERRRGPAAPIPEGPPEPYAGTPLGAGLTQIRMLDPSFTTDRFLQGARAAFEMILGAFAAGDTKALRPLLNDEVFGYFKTAIDERRSNGETLETELVAVKSAEPVEATVEGRTAAVTIKFVTEQVNATRDAKGEVVEGDPNRITEVVDLWTFARDLRSRDPNWLLTATRSVE